MSEAILQQLIISKKNGNKELGILLDPDKTDISQLPALIQLLEKAAVDYILVGGSLLTTHRFDELVQILKKLTNIPLILFPSGTYQVSPHADALLFLSLISGRNPELLIGKHVEAAPLLHKLNLEIIPTGYMLIDGGIQTTVSYISNTTPIPYHKPEIGAFTALAGQYLGMKLIYMDAGSGAIRPIPIEMIQTVISTIELPLIVGGGIKTPEQAFVTASAGADLIIVGNHFEKDPTMIPDFAAAIKSAGKSVKKPDFNA